ncbi:agmatinase [Bradyrhizobium sp. NBAIM01]|nr:agmatinase [Bradyrhizobium sp. NBAIM01]
MSHALPPSGNVVPKYAGLPTFMKLEQASATAPPDVVIIGVPFDNGSTVRPGSRFGPRAIRDASTMLRPFHPAYGISPFSQILVADGGDVAVNPLDFTASMSAIENEVSRWRRRGSRVLAIGGDHLISLAVLRGKSDSVPYAVVHLDAHSDTEDEFFGSRYNHGTVFRRAIEERLVSPTAFFQIGLRGTTYGVQEYDFAREQGLTLFFSEEAEAIGAEAVARHIRKVVGDLPVYVSFDIDGIDATYCPGTGTPEIGGLDVKFCLRLLRELRGLTIVGADVVEVSPPFDVGQQTSLVAAHLLFELLCLLTLAPARKDAS